MSKAEKTREYIIEKSAPFFNRKGYAGTALSDIIEATGLTKGSIYGNFENKDELAIAVYQYQVLRNTKSVEAALEGKTTATEKMIAFTESYRNNWKTMFERGGCPVQNASVEADDNLHFLKKHVQNSIKRWASIVTGIIEEGQQKGEFKKDLAAGEYAYEFLMMLEGGIMFSKIMNDPKLLFKALDRIVLTIKKELKK